MCRMCRNVMGCGNRVWRDEEAIRLWREQSEHKSTQKEGREILFAGYRIRVAQVVRDYCLESSPWQN